MASRRKPQVLREVRHMAREVFHVGREFKRATEYRGRTLYKQSRMLGPGLIAGAADDDAGGIATYSIIGATTGYALTWLMLVSTPMLVVVQTICARLGNITHKGLATLMKEQYGIKLALCAALVLVIANVATISADVSGMAVAAELVTGIDWWYFVVPLSLLIIYVIIFKNFNTIQKVSLRLSLVLVAYVVAGVLAFPDWRNVLISTFVPKIDFSLPFITAAVGLLGTTITPYLFFWQTATEVEAKRTEKQLKKVDFDIFTGMIYSNIISYFIIISSGTILFPHLQQLGSVSNAPDPVRFIALALKPVAGDYSFYLFAIGLFAASVLAVVVLASSTAYVVSETMGWNRGLNKKLRQARKFYSVIALSIMGGIAVLATGIKPIDAMYYSQVLCGVLDPILLVMLIKLASDEKLMGVHALSGRWRAMAWATVGVITLFVVFLLRGIFLGS
jgi:NRAMP (natural resistance-associated macrophage protein)-like metal ion transporter